MSLLKKLSRKASAEARAWMEDNLQTAMNLYPPYLGAGIEVERISNDFREIDVSMTLTPYNRNYVGTHFGGSLYAMCDPFYMLMLMKNLGSEYIVWDKAASIDFKKPGRGTVTAEFRLDPARVESIRQKADSQYKFEPTFYVEVTDEQGNVVAEVEKLLYVRRKDATRPDGEGV
ncbi:MAG: DUF4442 domain-containing protein [Myxococcota bacterium]